MRALTLWLSLTTVALTASGQEFDAIVIKPNKTASNSSGTHVTNSQFITTNSALRNLIVMAYGVKDYQVEGPEWMRGERFDIAAKFPEGVAGDEDHHNVNFQAMMQNMLAQRFKLAVHRETRTLPAYGLVVAKNGPKLKENPECGGASENVTNGHYEGTCISMDSFAAFVARRMNEPVLNASGLPGHYDITVDFVEVRRLAADAKNDATAADPGATMEQTLQEQLGLKLDTRKAPIQIVVVDHVEKVPTEN